MGENARCAGGLSQMTCTVRRSFPVKHKNAAQIFSFWVAKLCLVWLEGPGVWMMAMILRIFRRRRIARHEAAYKIFSYGRRYRSTSP